MRQVSEDLIRDVKLLIEKGDEEALASLIDELRPADVADLIEHLDHDERLFVFKILEPEGAGEVLVEIEPPIQGRLLEDLDNDALSEIVQELESDVAATGNVDVNLESLLDVPVTISMEIGRTRINIRNLLQLNQGSVVELDRLAGEPMDVLVNGTLIAQGEVVVVNEKFGIRLTDVISPADRVKRLQ